jgi:hypothetical protein
MTNDANTNTDKDSVEITQPKRTRATKKSNPEPENNIQISLEEPESATKKRGRKPKGGKLIVKQAENAIQPMALPNIILHLKCSLNDLHEYNDKIHKLMTDPLSYDPTVPPTIMSYNETQSNHLKYDTLTDSSNVETFAYVESEKPQLLYAKCNCDDRPLDDDDHISVKDINSKLKRLKLDLYKNNLPDKKSACFWCTYDYDNPSCYIPKYEMDGVIHGYGSFCRPECAVAYLMKESIDDSTKFERYHLLNNIYSKIYDFKKNIKPAPNPYFLLEKYYGNLTIQEYRKLLKTEHMLLVIDKPLTRILPELHEDNEDMVLNIYGNTNTKSQGNTVSNGVYKVKRQSEKQQGPSKSSIMRDKFGFSG